MSCPCSMEGEYVLKNFQNKPRIHFLVLVQDSHSTLICTMTCTPHIPSKSLPFCAVLLPPHSEQIMYCSTQFSIPWIRQCRSLSQLSLMVLTSHNCMAGKLFPLGPPLLYHTGKENSSFSLQSTSWGIHYSARHLLHVPSLSNKPLMSMK